MLVNPIIDKAIKLLKAWGCDIVVEKDSNTNGIDRAFEPIGVIRHHTASSLKATEQEEINWIMHGGDYPPWAQFFVARDGTIHVTCQWRANHAGKGGPWRGIPLDSANRYTIGVEVSNNGTTEAYGTKTMTSSRLLDAALLIAMNRDSSWLIGHKEWAPRRKIDPLYNMDNERKLVAEIIKMKTAPNKPIESAGVGSYTVKSGDTLSSIVRRLGINILKLISFNKIKDPDLIEPGQVLKTSIIYIVKENDTLFKIAARHNTDPAIIAKVNKLNNPDLIQPGQVLRIPF